MARKIEFEIEGAKALAIMHDDTTPKACDAIWNKLPLEGPAIMAKWACREIMLHLAGDMYIELESEGQDSSGKNALEHRGPIEKSLEEREKQLHTQTFRNLSVRPRLGYFLRGPGLLGAQKEYAPEFQRRLCEITIYYGLSTGSPGDPGRNMDQDKWEEKPIGPRAGLTWAHFQRPIPQDFYLKCENIRHGRKKITIRRYVG